MPTKKKFCLWCPAFKPENWCLGYCTKKGQYLKVLIRNCAVGISVKSMINRRTWTLQYWEKCVKWAQIRADLAKEHFDQLEEMAKEIEEQ